MRQNIAGWCQQTFCFQKFDDNAQQIFAFKPQANFPAHNLNFIEGDGIKSGLPFKTCSTLQQYDEVLTICTIFNQSRVKKCI